MIFSIKIGNLIKMILFIYCSVYILKLCALIIFLKYFLNISLSISVLYLCLSFLSDSKRSLYDLYVILSVLSDYIFSYL